MSPTLIALVASREDRIRRRAEWIIAAFLVIHGALHLSLVGDPAYEFSSVLSQVLILGVTYKKGTSDTRESPALDIMQALADQGARVSFYDPHVREVSTDAHSFKGHAKLGPTALRRADCTVVVTDHGEIDYRAVVRNARRVLDTRNATRGVPDPKGKVVRL